MISVNKIYSILCFKFAQSLAGPDQIFLRRTIINIVTCDNNYIRFKVLNCFHVFRKAFTIKGCSHMRISYLNYTKFFRTDLFFCIYLILCY